MAKSQKGNIFFALFGAVAFVGVLGVATMSFIKGPLRTSVTISRLNVAQTQMQVASQMAVLESSSEADFGDCDSDGYVEPMEWKAQADNSKRPLDDAGTGGAGGNIPNTLGATKLDPWGQLYGYCVWNSGSDNTAGSTGACDDDGDGTEQRLSGSVHNYDVVLAVISAGSDRTFQTKCLTFAQADNDSSGVLGDDAGDEELVFKSSGSDDVILTYTYAEAATVGGGGLWSIKSSDPSTATIDKAIEFSGGLSMGTEIDVTNCTASNPNVMRYNTFADEIQVCDGAGNWEPAGGTSAAFTDNNAVACDGATAGQVRFNTMSQLPEFCDGAGWRVFTLSATTVTDLVLTPTSANTMDVDGTNNKDATNCSSPWICGDEVEFTLQNMGATDSAPVAWSLDSATNFVVTSENCAGAVLAQMDNCSIRLRPRSDGNKSYSTRVNVSTNNSPFSIVQGTATGFGCSPGFSGGGGTYVACGLNDGDGTYDLVIMPSGCNGAVSDPLCSGTDGASVLKSWGPTNTDVSEHICNNPGTACNPAQQHVNIMAYQGEMGVIFPAAHYCENMDYNGYTDWFLPSRQQLISNVRPEVMAGRLTGFNTGNYTTSVPNGHSNVEYMKLTSSYNNNTSRSSVLYTRCIRRENLPLPTRPTDVTPYTFNFATEIATVSGETRTSNIVTVEGNFDPIAVSISGASGSPSIIHNGADVGASAPTVIWGDTLQLQMDAPTVSGTKHTVTINVGPYVYTWDVHYFSSFGTARIFVTESTYAANGFGSLFGVDNRCIAEAAKADGLPSKWIAILSDTTTSATDRIPFNWDILETVTGKRIVSNGVDDLFDGFIENAIDINQHGVAVTGDVWSGTNSTGGSYSFVQETSSCRDWSTHSATSGRTGLIGETDGKWISNGNGSCWSGKRLFCIEDINDTGDTTPNIFYPETIVQVVPSSRQNSATVTIGGMSAGETQALSVSASSGTPTFTINGGAEITSGAIENGDEIVFYLTAPATDGAGEKMTITAGSMTTYYRVWSGDSSGTDVKRVFVTDAIHHGNFGGVIGGDAKCQAAADAQALGGTWKTILSGIDDQDFAVNRIGYDWSELQLVDGTTVAYAPNLWETDTIPLLSPIIMNESGVNVINARTYSNTNADGSAIFKVNDATYNCNNWTSSSNTATSTYGGNTSSTSTSWIRNTSGFYDNRCHTNGFHHLYCIEQ